MLPGNGPKPVLYGTTLPVSDMPMNVRPWNAPVSAITPGRPVCARAILMAFSTASAPVVKNAVFLACAPGVIAFRRSAKSTAEPYGTIWKAVCVKWSSCSRTACTRRG